MEFINENSKTIVDLVAAATALGAAWAFYVRWVRPKWTRILGTWDAIDRIEKELRFNGGFSTKDIVGRLEKNVTTISGDVANVAHDVSLVRGIQRAMMSEREVPFFETDALGRCVWVNRYYLDLTGKQLADVLVNGWGGIIAGEDRAAVLREWEDCVKSDRDFEMHYRILDADQKKVEVRAAARRVKNQAGHTIAFAGSMTLLNQPTAH